MQLEITIGSNLQLIHLHMPGRGHVPGAGEGARLGLDTEIVDRAPIAADEVVQAAVHRAVQVDIVGVVITYFGGFVGQGVKLWVVRIPELQMLFQGEAQQAGEVAIPLGPGQFIPGNVLAQHLRTDAFQVITKSCPGLTRQQGLDRCFSTGHRSRPGTEPA